MARKSSLRQGLASAVGAVFLLVTTCAVCKLCDSSGGGSRVEAIPKKSRPNGEKDKRAAVAVVEEPPKAELHPVTTKRVDCRKRGRPGWCRKINYATVGEKMGTLILVHRSDVPGTVHWCSSDANGRHYYVSQDGGDGYVPDEVVAKNKAVAMSLHPRDTRGSADGRFFLAPEGADISSWDTFKDCPGPRTACASRTGKVSRGPMLSSCTGRRRM